MLLGVSYGEDHVPAKRDGSSGSKSSRSSVYKHEEYSHEVTKQTFIMNFNHVFYGG